VRESGNKEERRVSRGERGGEPPQSPPPPPATSLSTSSFLALLAAVRSFQPELVHRLKL